MYIVKDHHLHASTDEKLKLVTSEANQGGCRDLFKHMIEVKWSKRHVNILKINEIDQTASLIKENCVVILPEDTKMNVAVSIYTVSHNYNV